MRRLLPPLLALAFLPSAGGCTIVSKADLAARIDRDDDGFISSQFGGDDCDDSDGSAFPGAVETPYDGVDADCSGTSDNDADGDDHDDLGHGGDDCDDQDPAVHPGAVEACNGLDDDCDGRAGDPADASTDESDQDADLSLVCAGDCDDADATVHPGAAEVCDDANTDEDCDGSTDDGDNGATGQTDWYLDSDHDGYGTPDTVSRQCDPPADYVANADDCDDADATFNPETPWYRDVDEDGWGDDADTLAQCTQPDGYVLPPGDCDDADPAVRPDALEACNGLDDDCDALVDADDPGVDPDEAVWYRDRDDDGYGDPGSSVVSCAVGAGYVHAADDCDDDAATVNPGATEVCDAQDNDCDGYVDDDDGSVADRPTWYSDVDGDGFGDPTSTRVACEEPWRYRASGTDCDDGDASIHPMADAHRY